MTEIGLFTGTRPTTGTILGQSDRHFTPQTRFNRDYREVEIRRCQKDNAERQGRDHTRRERGSFKDLYDTPKRTHCTSQDFHLD